MIDDKKRYHNCGHLHDDKRLPYGQLTVDERGPEQVIR